MDHFHPKMDTADGCSEVIDPEAVARRVRAVIAQRGTTTAAVARALSVPYSTAHRRINGKRELTATDVGLLSRMLGVPVDELLFGRE